MARIKNFALTPELTRELLNLAGIISPPELVDWARECLPGGFTKSAIIRQRLEARIRSEGMLDIRTIELIRPYVALCGTASMLSFEAIQALTPDLLVLCQPAEWILALLFDAREEVFKFGTELAGKPEPPGGIDERTLLAEQSFLDFVDTFFYEAVGVFPETPGEDDAAGSKKDFIAELKSGTVRNLEEQLEKQKGRIQHLTNELHQQKLRHEARHRDQVQALERERKQLHAEEAKYRDKLHQTLAEKDALAAELTELDSNFEAALAAKVQEQTSSAVRKWLEQPVRVEAELQSAKSRGADVLARAQQALEAQAHQDKHTGNRLQLEKHLAELEAMRQRLTDAFGAAITPVADVKNSIRELEAEIEKLHRVLRRPRQGSELESRLRNAINEAATWEQARTVSGLLDQLADASVLDAEERRALYGALDRKSSLLAETGRGKPGEVESGWALRDYLFRNRSALLVLDGHNVLYGLEDLFSAFYEEGHPRKRARDALVEMMRCLVKDRVNIHALVCFDGPISDARKPVPNLEVFYSGGTGQNRADQLIISQLQFKGLHSLDQKVFVVSDDREIRSEIVRTGARFVRTDLFAVLLRDFGCLKLQD